LKYGAWSLTSPRVDKGRIAADWGANNLPCRLSDTTANRECQWRANGYANCTPGTTISVGVGGCGLGSASRAALLRVCRGGKPCQHGDSTLLAATDHSQATVGCPNGGGANLPSVSFTCPSEGRIFAMVGAQDSLSTAPFIYTVAKTDSFHNFTRNAQPADLEGATITGGGDNVAAASYVINKVTAAPAADDPTHNTNLYDLRLASNSTQQLCGGDPTAVPLRGTWREGASTWMDSDTFMTFGCQRGVLAKCYLKAHYRPWDSFNGKSLRDYHQTCMRAALADYCGNGTSYTVNGTIIDLYDRLGKAKEVPSTGEFASLAVEGIWQSETTGEVASVRPVLCLAKKRWDTIPFKRDGLLCPGVRDPRTFFGDPDGHGPQAHYCDELSADANDASGWFGNPDVLEANKSAYIDAGLWRWTRTVPHTTVTDHHVTTQFTTTNGGPPDSSYKWDALATAPEPVFLGAVYTNGHRSDGVRPSYAIALCSWRRQQGDDFRITTCTVDPEDEHVTSAPPAPDYTAGVLEGYIDAPSCVNASPACPTNKPLRSYHVGNDYFVSVPGVVLPPGAEGGELLGYLPN
jgi:hypothetical protein